jgi:hypothetical protein
MIDENERDRVYLARLQRHHFFECTLAERHLRAQIGEEIAAVESV